MEAQYFKFWSLSFDSNNKESYTASTGVSLHIESVYMQSLTDMIESTGGRLSFVDNHASILLSPKLPAESKRK